LKTQVCGLTGFHQRKGIGFTFQISGFVEVLVDVLAALLVTTVLEHTAISVRVRFWIPDRTSHGVERIVLNFQEIFVLGHAVPD
jgi:hypothetical protein